MDRQLTLWSGGRIVLAGLLGAIFYAVVTHVFAAPPIRMLSMSEQDSVAVRGGVIELLVHRKASKICPVHTDRVLWQWRDGPDHKKIPYIVPLPFRSTAIVPDGADIFVVSVDVPGNIERGDWFYVARSEYDCAWFPNWFGGDALQTQPIPIKVVDPTPSSNPKVIMTPAPLTIVAEPKP
jgi:hypothetical protein